MRLPNNTPMAERLAFWSIEDPTTGCRLWTGAKDADGYGHTSVKAKRYLAHRAAYEAVHGPIPEGMCVLHRCDTPGCINEQHLFLGTKGSNNKDRAAKGRSADSHGERHSNNKLTNKDVIAIRSDTRPHRCIAADYGVTQTTISNVLSRRTWNHI